MIQNYLKVALRNLRRHPSFSFINIFGLAASLSVCLLAIIIVKDAHSFDLFHPAGERVYRIITDAQRKSGGEETYASSPYQMARALNDDFSYVENWVPVGRSLRADFRANGKELEQRGLLTNAEFFKVFGFELALGDPATALSDPYHVVLTHEAAQKYFGDADPIGQVLENEALGNFIVTGVLAEFPGKTHFEFNVLASFSTLPALEEKGLAPDWLDNWNEYYSGYNYVKLRPGIRPETVELALADISKTAYADLELEARDAGYRFRLQPLGAISPGPIMSCTMGRAMPSVFLWFLSALSAVVIFSACFNYTNLTVARSLTRVQEVGVRKVLGATRQQVFSQFLSESVVTAMLALVLGFLILQLFLPSFSRLGLFNEVDVNFGTDGKLVGWFAGFTILIGILAGLIPAVLLSRFSPLSILQKLQNTKVFRQIGLRKVLIVSQFSISLIFLLVMTIIWKQTTFSVAETFGSDRSDIVHIDLQGQPFDRVEAAFGQIAGVEKLGGASHLMGTWEDSSVDLKVDEASEKTEVRDYTIDHRFLDLLGLNLVAGENFTENLTQAQELSVIVNEKFLEEFEMGEPGAAIGQTITLGDSSTVAIRGVVEDFLFKPMNYFLEPLLLRYQPDNLGVLSLQVQASDMPAFITSMERTWDSLESGHDLEYEFYDEAIEAAYADVYDLMGIVAFFGVLGLIIATLGLLGMAIFTVESRTKEVSIRKVIGARAGDLVLLLSKGYVWLLLIAVCVAVPASFFLGKMLLQTFAVSIPLNVWVFLPAVGALVIIGGLTIGSQTVRAALANPVENLKDD